MQKSQMMMLVVVMAICCFSCISSVTMVAGIGNSLGPLNDFLNNQQEENNIQSTGNPIREHVVKACNICKQNNWEGTVRTYDDDADVPCGDLSETCDEILKAVAAAQNG